MKKTVLFAVMMMGVLSVMVVSCNDGDSFNEAPIFQNSGHSIQHLRSYADALAIAEGSLSMLDETMTRSGDLRRIDESDTHYIVSSTTRAGVGGFDTLLYVFNFADNAGFAVVSANASATGLLAVTESGNYTDGALEQNKGLALFMEMAKGYSSNKRDGLEPFSDTLSVFYNYINPLISVIWGQGFPEGLYFPNTIAGCSNTAMTLVASYFEHPTQMQLTFPQKDTTSITLNWPEIKSHIRGASSYNTETMLCTASVDAHKNLGRFCRQLAHLNSSTFYLNGDTMLSNSPLQFDYYSYYEIGTASTATSISSVRNTFNTLNYTISPNTNYSSASIRYYLNNHRIIVMNGFGVINGSTVGHTWVIDGYRDKECHIYSYATQPPSVIETHHHYNHINWGWDGLSNGYFYDGVFTANEANTYDYFYYHVPYSFSINLQQYSVYL